MQPTLAATLSPQIVPTSPLSRSELSSTSPHPRIQVIRRDGTSTALNIGKIRAVVDWACAKLNANSIALEAGLTTRLRDGISTREIQD
ncbi:MAG: ATP cone domain-containing protein, partial [Snowella sp.]